MKIDFLNVCTDLDLKCQAQKLYKMKSSRNHNNKRIVLLATLVVRNTFISASWIDIIRALDIRL